MKYCCLSSSGRLPPPDLLMPRSRPPHAAADAEDDEAEGEVVVGSRKPMFSTAPTVLKKEEAAIELLHQRPVQQLFPTIPLPHNAIRHLKSTRLPSNH